MRPPPNPPELLADAASGTAALHASGEVKEDDRTADADAAAAAAGSTGGAAEDGSKAPGLVLMEAVHEALGNITEVAIQAKRREVYAEVFRRAA